MKKLGLDLGSSSVGWFLREDNELKKGGVVTFHSGMVKGTGGYSSPTKDRREARSKRRLLQARKYRKWELLNILLPEFAPLDATELEVWSKYKKGQVRKFPENPNFMKWLACDFSYLGINTEYKNPYDLRVDALDHKLSKHEFGRALYHIVQRRGYKDIGEKDKETETQIARRGESGFQNALDNNRSIAEALKIEFLDKDKRARNQYPYREEYKHELEQICQAQGYDTRKNEKGEYADSFVQNLWKAIIWQRPLRSQKGNIGKCTLEPTKPRCPISHPIFEIFRAWGFINTIRYYDKNNEKQTLTTEQRENLFDFFLKKEKNFKFEEIRKFLDKQLGSKKKYNYPINKEGMYDTSVSGMPVCKGLTDVLGKEIIQKGLYEIDKFTISNAPKIINAYSIYDLWHILFAFDEKAAKDQKFLEKFAIEKLKIQNERPKKGSDYNPFTKLKEKITQGYSDLSLKAMCKIIPFLKEGYLYNEAVVLAKIPELLGKQWDTNQDQILATLTQSKNQYNWEKEIATITNKLIDKYKGLEHEERFAYKDFQYKLDSNDLKLLEETCEGHFGEKTWNEKTDKNDIFNAVKEQYQDFFGDNKRAYRENSTLTSIFKEKLKDNDIEITGELYHHSNTENKYLKRHIDPKTGNAKLPSYKNKITGIEVEILPEPRIDSIKNPMFNKSLSILRKLINELIKEGAIDTDTEIVVEVARELNDNNKRSAIERYQNERKNIREKYREFLKEYKEKEKPDINIEERIVDFELWAEQTFEETKDETGNKVTNKNHAEILREKEAVKRYELWMEQKGQCMYTGKMISITQLFSNEIDIEHTIPRSLLPDNTMANQTVCYSWYNRDKKKNQLPRHCNNYSQDIEGWGTCIEPRLKGWIEKRESYKKLYEDRLRPKGSEDETSKNKRIQDKHYFKMHYDYWHDKIERFEANEVKDSWARRQLVDTQMVSKYAREFLKTFFKKVAVQKGSVTADFRKIYGFQEVDEIKSRNRHTHHAIDAAVLTLIPANSSHRERVLKEYYYALENFQEIKNRKPYEEFNSQILIQQIESNTLIVNYENDKILKQSYRNVRKRGKLQYVKNKQAEFIHNNEGKKILKKAKGDTVRSTLHAQTYLGKIRDVERYEDGQPKRNGDDWIYKTGKDEYLFVKREDINKVKASDNLIKAIVDPVIKEIVSKQKNNSEIKDYNNKVIRHVRVKTSAGKEVKERINYRSQHEYKNKFYSEAGSLPYAILLQKGNTRKNLTKEGDVPNEKIERVMIPIASYEVAKMYKKSGKFDLDQYVREFYSKYVDYPDKKLLKVGQKVIVLKNDEEYKSVSKVDFQTKRLYKVTQFGDGSIYLKYHLEATPDDDIDSLVKLKKDQIVTELDNKYGLPLISEDQSIIDVKVRKKKYEDDRFRFVGEKDNRFKRLLPFIGSQGIQDLRKTLSKYKTQSTSIDIEGETPLLKINKAEDWNFLYEGEDFEISLFGKISLKE